MTGREIEFVDEPVPATPDDDPPAHERRSRGRRWWALRIATAVVIVAAGAVWLATRPSPSAPLAQSSTSASSAPDAIPPVAQRLGASTFCMSGLPATEDLTAAIKRALPDATLSTQSTYQCVRVYGFDEDRRIVYQAITASQHDVNIDVEVTARGPRSPGVPQSPRHDESRPGRVLLAGVTTESVSVRVFVTAYGGPSGRAPGEAMSHLADRLALDPPGLDGVGLDAASNYVGSGGVKGHVLH